MERVQYERFGDPEDVLQISTEEVPPPDAGQVRVRVEAAPIHPSDLLTIHGRYGRLPKTFPVVPGSEGVGRVVDVGAGVTNVKFDDLVALPLGSGTWRTAMTIDANGLFPLPDNVDPLQLAMLAINGMTASLLLSEIVKLRPGDWVILNAANSSVGHYLVALARRRKIKTLGLIRRNGGTAYGLRETGATEIVVDQGQNIAAEVTARVGGGRVALGLDAVGGPATDVLAGCVSGGGTVVVYGGLGEEPCRISPEAAIFRDVRLVGFWLARWLESAPPETVRARYQELLELARKGQLRAEVEGTYPLSRLLDAVKDAAAPGRNGKILFTPDGPSW